MFDLKRLFRRRTTAREPGGSKAPATAAQLNRIRLLAITQNDDDRAAMRRIADDHEWQVLFAASSSSARQLLEREPAPLVIICDRDLPGEDWRYVVAVMASLSDAHCVLLASTVVDDYLWEEVIKHKGYDVVIKPFEAGQLGRLVAFAESRARWHTRLRA